MRLLNRQYRGIDRTTDVLSFPQYSAEELKIEIGKFSQVRTADLQTSSDHLPLGDLVINLHMAKRQAFDNRLSVDEEVKRLITHGMLHLLGYDHEQGKNAARKMRMKSNELSGNLR